MASLLAARGLTLRCERGIVDLDVVCGGNRPCATIPVLNAALQHGGESRLGARIEDFGPPRQTE